MRTRSPLACCFLVALDTHTTSLFPLGTFGWERMYAAGTWFPPPFRFGFQISSSQARRLRTSRRLGMWRWGPTLSFSILASSPTPGPLCFGVDLNYLMGQFRLCPSRVEKRHFYGPNYVERRSLWAENNNIKVIHLKSLVGHSVKLQRTSPKAKPHIICKHMKFEFWHLKFEIWNLPFPYNGPDSVGFWIFQWKKSSASRRKFGSSILLERPNSWRHNFLKVMPPRLFWRRHPLDFGL